MTLSKKPKVVIKTPVVLKFWALKNMLGRLWDTNVFQIQCFSQGLEGRLWAILWDTNTEGREAEQEEQKWTLLSWLSDSNHSI